MRDLFQWHPAVLSDLFSGTISRRDRDPYRFFELSNDRGHTHIGEMDDAVISAHDDDKRRSRRCLRCDTIFESEWAGERICRHCKSSYAWRSGEALRVQRLKPGSAQN
jgi:hypothetical protein